VRAGVLEQGTVDLLVELGAGERLLREGMVHHGLELRFGRRGHRIALSELTGGRAITLYGQQEVVKDLIAARIETGAPLLFEVDDVRVSELESERPRIRFRHDGAEHELDCDVIAGCDGFHGICRPAVPDGVLTVYEREYPHAWLGILAEVAPSTDELIYAHSERGFALHSMRSPQLSRLYLQVAPDTDIGDWPDERIWDELQARFDTDDGWTLNRGAVVEKGVTPMRSFVAEPMQHGRLFLAGDAAHTVPPTGAKGLNLAVADVHVLDRALGAYYRSKDTGLLESYTATALRRVWRAQWFSFWMTSMLHRFSDASDFDLRRQIAELELVTTSPTAATTLAQHYTGMPLG
jgi:p-hydroxybenzoate 3-monooxygenase